MGDFSNVCNGLASCAQRMPVTEILYCLPRTNRTNVGEREKNKINSALGQRMTTPSPVLGTAGSILEMLVAVDCAAGQKKPNAGHPLFGNDKVALSARARAAAGAKRRRRRCRSVRCGSCRSSLLRPQKWPRPPRAALSVVWKKRRRSVTTRRRAAVKPSEKSGCPDLLALSRPSGRHSRQCTAADHRYTCVHCFSCNMNYTKSECFVLQRSPRRRGEEQR